MTVDVNLINFRPDAPRESLGRLTWPMLVTLPERVLDLAKESLR